MTLSRRLIIHSPDSSLFVGWVERSETQHHAPCLAMLGLATARPNLRRLASGRVDAPLPSLRPHARRGLVEELVQPRDRLGAARVFRHHALEKQAVVV